MLYLEPVGSLAFCNGAFYEETSRSFYKFNAARRRACNFPTSGERQLPLTGGGKITSPASARVSFKFLHSCLYSERRLFLSELGIVVFAKI